MDDIAESPPPGWHGLSGWWIDEVAADPAYAEVVDPLIVQMLQPSEGERVLDVGCGEGRLVRLVASHGAQVVGVDSDPELLSRAARSGPVARMTLPHLAIVSGCFEAAFLSLVLEHLEDYRGMLAEIVRVLRPSGCLVVVANHPMFTAPDSAPVYDTDGELLWRPGRYFEEGYTDEPAGGGTIRFHHRSMGELLTTAADVGLALERLIEVGPSAEQIARTPSLADQAHIPRLVGVRWRKTTAVD